ncbi:hypothetical protein BKA80DRAFT_336847 [Phyllosticta citrichinensis]
MTPRKPPTEPRAERWKQQAAAQDPGGSKASADSPAKLAHGKQATQPPGLPEASATLPKSAQPAPGPPDIGSFRPTRAAPSLTSSAQDRSTDVQRTIAQIALARLAGPSQEPASQRKDAEIPKHGTGTPTSEPKCAGSPMEIAAHGEARPSHPHVSQISAPLEDETRRVGHAAVSLARKDDVARPRFSNANFHSLPMKPPPIDPPVFGHPSVHPPKALDTVRPGEMRLQYRESQYNYTTRRGEDRHRGRDPYPDHCVYSTDPNLPKIKVEDDDQLTYELELAPVRQEAPPAPSPRTQRAIAREESKTTGHSAEQSKLQYCGRCANDHKTEDCQAEECRRCHSYHLSNVSCFEAGSVRAQRGHAAASTDAPRQQAAQPTPRQSRAARRQQIRNQAGKQKTQNVCDRCGGGHTDIPCKTASQRAEREAARQTRSIQQSPQQDEDSANAASKTEENDVGKAAIAPSKIEGNNVGKSMANGNSSETQCSQCGYVHEGTCQIPFCHDCCSFHLSKFNCFEARTIRAQRDAFYAAKEGNPEARAEPHTEPLAQIQSPQPQTLPALPGPQGQTQYDNSLYSETLKFFYEKDGPEGALNFYARFGAGQQFPLPMRPSPHTSVARSIEESMVQPTPTDHNIAKHRQSPGNDSTDWGTDYTSESEDEEERVSPKAVPKAKRRRLDKEDDEGLSTLRRERKRKTTRYETEPSPKAKRSEAKAAQRTNKRKHESEDELEDQEPKRRKSGKESQPVKRKSQAMTKAKQPIKREPESDSSDDELPPAKSTKAKQPIKRAHKSDSSDSSDSESSDDESTPPKPKKLRVQDSRPKVAAKKPKREAEQKAKEKKPKKVAVVTKKAPAMKEKKTTKKAHENKKTKKHK